jgi:hypothetical protein
MKLKTNVKAGSCNDGASNEDNDSQAGQGAVVIQVNDLL